MINDQQRAEPQPSTLNGLATLDPLLELCRGGTLLIPAAAIPSCDQGAIRIGCEMTQNMYSSGGMMRVL